VIGTKKRRGEERKKGKNQVKKNWTELARGGLLQSVQYIDTGQLAL
jgi:hypothetical protein